jgi:hypothetical protein
VPSSARNQVTIRKIFLEGFLEYPSVITISENIIL